MGVREPERSFGRTNAEFFAKPLCSFTGGSAPFTLFEVFERGIDGSKVIRLLLRRRILKPPLVVQVVYAKF